jgi:DNA polymerase I-like protein with 3'-5' exonuclease and polymerase domains
MVQYCIADTVANVDVFNMLKYELRDFSDESIHLEHRVAEITKVQESNGFKLDFPLACSIHTQHTARMKEIEQELQEVFPPIVEERWSEKTGKRLKDKVTIFNPGSRVQVAERLAERGAVWKELTPTSGRAKVDETTLGQNLHVPEAKLVLEYLIISKRLGMVTAWVNAVAEDGRIHGRVNTCGAVTGRMTHSKPNLAQIPSDPTYRECFTVEDGNQLVGCDASGLELRMLAHYMRDTEYTDLILNGDIHTHNQKLAGLQHRDDAKTFIYALLYGAGDAKIGTIINGGAKAGRTLRHKFMSGLPAYARLLEKIGKRLADHGTLPGLDGRRLHVRSEHAALNTLLQSAGAVVMKKALVLATDALQDAGIPCTLVAQVHDEVQVEAEPQYAEQVGQAFRKAIQDAGTYYEMRCPLDGEYKVGPNWSHTH